MTYEEMIKSYIRTLKVRIRSIENIPNKPDETKGRLVTLKEVVNVLEHMLEGGKNPVDNEDEEKERE